MSVPALNPPPQPPPQRVAAAWFLGFAGVALVVFLWLRGAGRAIVPLLLVGAVAWIVVRVARKIREPLP